MIHNFDRLIQKYFVKEAFLLSKSEGAFVDGVWVEGTVVTTPLECAIKPLSESTVYRSSGNYTKKDRRVYSFKRLNLQDQILYKNSTYSVEEEVPQDEYSNFYAYVVKDVSVIA